MGRGAGGKEAVGFSVVRTKCPLCALSLLGSECTNLLKGCLYWEDKACMYETITWELQLHVSIYT